jgi:phosphoglycolate phosphatase-like HAD superfamily hydrolase
MTMQGIRRHLLSSHRTLEEAATFLPLDEIAAADQATTDWQDNNTTGEEPSSPAAHISRAAAILNEMAGRLPQYEALLNSFLQQADEAPLPPANWPAVPAQQNSNSRQQAAKISARPLAPATSETPQLKEPDKKYTHILWDWDGNLARTLHVWLQAYRITLRENGFKLTDQQIAHSMGAFRQDLMTWGQSEAEANRIVGEAHARAVPQLPTVDLYPGGKEAVTTLSSLKIKQGIITTSKRAYVEPPLRHHGLQKYFGAIAAGDEGKQKPDREPVDRLLQTLGGPIGSVAIIGDSWKDLATARNAGIDSILFYPAEHSLFYDLETLLEYEPTHVVSSLYDVPDIVGLAKGGP